MNLAKISANGQITLPVEIRRSLGLRSGDKVLFLQNQNGDIILTYSQSPSRLFRRGGSDGCLQRR